MYRNNIENSISLSRSNQGPQNSARGIARLWLLGWLFILLLNPLTAGNNQSSVDRVGVSVAANAELDTSGFALQLQQAWQQSSLKAFNAGFVTREGQWFTVSFGPARWTLDESEDVLSPDHIFRMASMTKAMTSVAALQLIEKGLLSLDEPLSRYLPALDEIPVLADDGTLRAAQKPVTLRHLLTHTSGFGYSFMDRRLAPFQRQTDWPHPDLPRLHEAGKAWTYGTSTDWVGYLVEAVSGLSLEAYFRRYISGPLGMNHTWFEVPDSLESLVVTMGLRDANGKMNPLPADMLRMPQGRNSGGGGLFSSLNDYMVFLACILNEGEYKGVRILEPQSIGLMFEDQLPRVFSEGLSGGSSGEEAEAAISLQAAPSAQEAHSLAWALEPRDNDFGRRKGTGFWSGIFNTYYSVDRQSGIAVVMLHNFAPFADRESIDLYKMFELMVRGDAIADE